MKTTPTAPPHGLSRWTTLFLCLRAALAALVVLAAPGTMAEDAVPVPEAKAKALFLATFVKYVDWPAEALSATNTPVVIGLVGKCDLEQELRALTRTTLVAGHSLTVRTIEAGGDAAGVHILFVPAGETKKAEALLSRLQSSPTLTVGEEDKFVPAGGMVALVRRESRIRPQVNLAAVERAGLKLSSKLLAVSEVVRGLPALSPK